MSHIVTALFLFFISIFGIVYIWKGLKGYYDDKPKQGANVHETNTLKYTDPKMMFDQMIESARSYAHRFVINDVVVICSEDVYVQVEQFLPSMSGVTGSYREDKLQVIFFTGTQGNEYTVARY